MSSMPHDTQKRRFMRRNFASDRMTGRHTVRALTSVALHELPAISLIG
jgi:hypothetical protein